jgi:hypothetical protein
MLRQRFGVLAHHPCHDLSGSDDGHHKSRKKNTLYASARPYDPGLSAAMMTAVIWFGLDQPTLG